MGDGQLQPEDTLDDRGVADILDEGISPPENYRGVTAKGVTAREELEGETLDERMRQEEPEVWDRVDEEEDEDSIDFPAGRQVGTARTGRLLAQGDDDDRFAEDEGIDGAGASAEEAAMHTIED